MTKRISLFLAAALSAAGMLWGQSLFYSPNQQMIETAVKGGLCIVQQNYQLEDTATHQRFGRYGDDNFGMARALAVRADSSIIADRNILSPWQGDDNFARYRQSHRPALSTASVIELDDTTATGADIALDSAAATCMRLLAAKEISGPKGFHTHSYNKPVEGWLVVVTGDTDLDKWTGETPTLRIFRKQVEFDATSEVIDMEIPPTSGKVWGGVFLVPEQTSIGQLNFIMGGILCRDTENDRWQLALPAQQSDKTTAAEEELTPLTQKPNKHDKKK